MQVEHTHTHTHTHTCMQTHTHTRTHTHTHKGTGMYTFTQVHTHTHTHISECMSITSHMLRKTAATFESGRRNAAVLTYGEGDGMDISIYTEPGGRNLLKKKDGRYCK